MFEKICLILLFNLLFFFKTLGYKYVSDDLPVSQRPKPKEWWKLRFQQLEGHIRTTPQEDHFLTTILHALVCVFIYTGFGASDVSFLAALLFSVNPINNQGSVWISGRGYVLSALGMLMALTFPYAGPVFLLLATYSNAGFIAPLCLIGSEHYWLLLFAPLCWLFWFKNFKKNVIQKVSMEMLHDDKEIKIEKLILGIKTFAFYLIHALIPIKTTFYHSYMQSLSGSGKKKAYSFKDRFFWLGIIIVGFILYRFTQPWDLVNFGLLWWSICILPFCNMFRMSQEIAERYAYLPNVGLMVALAVYLHPYPELFMLFMGVYATKLWFWMDSYQDDYYIVEASCLNSPESWFAWHIRGMKRWDNHSYPEAVVLWTMARMISPLEFKLNYNIATALHMSGHKDEAKQFLQIAANNIPKGQEKEAGKLINDWRSGNLAILL